MPRFALVCLLLAALCGPLRAALGGTSDRPSHPAHAGKNSAAPSKQTPTPEPLQIHLAPETALRRHTDLFRRKAGGNKRAKQQWERLEGPERLRALSQVLAYAQAKLRRQALRELRGLSGEDDPDGKALPALVKAALRDDDPALRKDAVQALVEGRDPKAPKLLAKQVAAKAPEVRRRAVKALRAIGGPRVYEAIIEHWRDIWGPGPRAHMFVARQQSYVADYEISGNSYDPIIRQFLVGTVLDVKPLLAWTDYYIVKALREVSGVNLGADRGRWEAWAAAERRKRAGRFGQGPLPNDQEEVVVLPVEGK